MERSLPGYRAARDAAQRTEIDSANGQPAADQDAERFLYSGLIRLHVLHHATREPIFGAALIDELSRHGYRLSAGTLYPILHGLEERGLLASSERKMGRSRRRLYQATGAGRRALRRVTQQVRKLFTELVEDGILHGQPPRR